MSNLEDIKDCPLHRRTPFAICNVRMTQFSIARFYGGIDYNGDRYTYFQSNDTLVRDDVLRWQKKRKKPKAGLKRIALFLALLLPLCATGQVIQLQPTAYALCIRNQNNVGKLWPSWKDETRDCVTLSNRVLTFSHVVYVEGVYFWGSRLGGPRLLEDTYSYRQIGGASYVPIGGEEITYFGGTAAFTNFVPASAMAPIFWLPGLVGEFVDGDKYRRTVTTGSSLVMAGRNLQNSAYLLRVPCEPDFCFAFRFKANERKPITLGMDTVSWFSNGDLQGFTFDLENCTDEALP